MKKTPRARGALLLLAAAFVAPSCLSPVRVEPRPAHELHQGLDRCALHGDFLSAWTSWLLRLTESEDAYRKDPIGTVRDLHRRTLEGGDANGPLLFALSELSYLAGKRRGDRGCFLGAAAYAYLYLLGEETPPSPYDRRFRWACDIYNRSLVRALKSPDDGTLRLEPGVREVPAGSLALEVDYSGFPFPTKGLELLPADELDVVGLDFRVRDSGLGAPLIAVAQRRGEGTAGVGILDETSVSATLFLRLHGGVPDMEAGLPAVLELHSTYDTTVIDVGGAEVPLEADPSAATAYSIEAANLWRFDILGLFKGRDASRQNGLILPRPFEPGRIPVVLVHGTASNPAYWAELLNSLQADPVIRGRVQFWYFLYATGNPIVYSAASLRESLQELVRERDPEGRDAALKHMVVVGHSQGGLLARMLGTHMDADVAAREMLGAPLDSLGLDASGLALLQRCFDFEPLPFVDRLVFVATPHRGSFLAARRFSRFLAKLIAVPGEIESAARGLVTRLPKERLPPGMEDRVPTSLDNMDPENPMIRFFAEQPLAARIHAHSIIPIGRAEEPAGADDGVVEYESAHLEGVDSELLVPARHSCQSHPRTIIELRRILREHVRSVDEHAAGGAAPADR